MPHTTVKIEPTTVASISAPAFAHVESVPRVASQIITGLQASSPISSSQDMMATPVRPVGAAAANVKILNDVAQARQALAGGTSLGIPSIGGTPILSNMISSGMTSSGLSAQTILSSGQSGAASVAAGSGNGTIEQNSAPASFSVVSSNVSGSANHGMSPTLTNLQGGVSMDQTLPGMSQGNLIGVQMVQSGLGMNENTMSSMGASMPSGTGTMMPTPGMSQPIQSGLQSDEGRKVPDEVKFEMLSSFLTRIAKLDELVDAAYRFLVGFQQALEFIKRPNIDMSHVVLEHVITANSTRQLSSYIEAGCFSTCEIKENISKLHTCHLGLLDHKAKAKNVVKELESILNNAEEVVRADVDLLSSCLSLSSKKPEVVPDYAILMTSVYWMVKKDYKMQEKVVSGLSLKSSLEELESYCLMWFLRPFVDNEIIEKAWRYVR